MDVKQLWKHRWIHFWSQIIPYLRYVVSGGLAAFLVVSFGVGGYFYQQFIEELPEGFPVLTIAVILLSITVFFSPIRTYVREQDKVFILPAEAKLGTFFRRGIVLSLVLQFFWTAFVWFLYWPLFRQASDSDSTFFFIVLAMLVVVKAINLLCHWKETQIFDPRLRIFYKYIRAIITVMAVYILLQYPIQMSAPFILFILLTYSVALRFPRAFHIHWEEWIRKENHQRFLIYMFISWFVDVEELPRRMKERRYLNVLSRWIHFKPQSTYTYLYFKTWLRSDVYPIILRITLIGVVIVFFLSEDVWKTVAFAVIVTLLGVQFNAVRQFHQHAQWLHIYPLPTNQRAKSVTRLNTRLHMFFSAIVAIPMFMSAENILWPAGAAVVVLVFIYGYHRRQHTRDR